MTLRKLTILLASTSFAMACSPSKGAKNIGQVAAGSVACPAFETFLHDQVQLAIEEDGSLPTLDDVKAGFSDALDENYPDVDDNLSTQLINNFAFFYAFLFEETDALPTVEEKSRLLISLEIGTHDDEVLQTEYNNRINAYTNDAKEIFDNCVPPEENPSIEPPENEDEDNDEIDDGSNVNSKDHTHKFGQGPFFSAIEEATDPAVFGALKTFATAYQSCEAISLQAIGNSDPDMKGVIANGRHPSGVGQKRYIGNLSDVQRTHPYIQSVISDGGSSCFNTYQEPLIYDFGGKPYYSSDSSNILNFFEDNGSGTPVLGTDCSGYIYTALMAAGLKLAPNRPLRVRGVVEQNARSFMNLTEMSCLAKIKAGKDQNPKAGDILASGGHIFIIDWVGSDPLGVEGKSSNTQCDTITHNDFDFTLMQSSPSKGAIGLNRMNAIDYLSESTSMKEAMISFARTHCKQKLAGNVMTPNHPKASLIRHKKTPECIQEDRIRLAGESCMDSCRI